ncbi:hypothetical protein [Ralstonia phage RpT1]|nr:hypothetical protein [Ralstonia phage RpT1]
MNLALVVLLVGAAVVILAVCAIKVGDLIDDHLSDPLD